jgi:hypothetical protein
MIFGAVAIGEFICSAELVNDLNPTSHDASARKISDNLEQELRELGADVTVMRIALNPNQIIGWQLLTRPGKKTDSHHKKFTAEFDNASVELDVLPPNVLN